MKIRLTTIVIVTLFISPCFGQNSNSLNGYKCVFIPTLEYNGGVDIFDISSTATGIFQDLGFTVVSDKTGLNSLPKEIQDNPCLLLQCQIDHTSPNALANTVTFTFLDCNNQIVYKAKGTGSMGIDIAGDYRIAVRKALSGIRILKYNFNPALTPEKTFPSVEKTSETEETIRTYLLSNKLDPIEGIYKSYQNEELSYYKFGILQQGDKIKAIIIESDYNQWKQGEVKAIFEQSSMKGFYSVKWFMGNKQPIETYGIMDNEALLSIEFKDPNTGEKRQDKFIKMFPQSSDNITFKKDNSKSSGSGFFITPDGIIATNAHVIEGASEIEIIVSNDVGNFTFKSKILLSDSNNDVALLKIDDKEFKGLTNIPYGIVENADVGSKVFTIGYPLNDIMGSNYKVTDGIISSRSGIADDIRYYQISVPLQPGNSGGPLFNKEGNVIGLTSSQLNSQAVGTQIENVNYAIKSSYLISLYNMLPNTSKLRTNSDLSSKELQDQVKILKNYVCLIRTY